eukprot:CAMPEP_0194545616 /NCGR_PEP_ID=MMETSP0253-20130528/89476_1 /TAXON_ID=2966 /ORGANISM="Noctiluca scintillans" /LENGTH=97 /DNA_ID=CAMNT_0039392623 /DNA_START=100 /DNA_END=390 /DNA_ORIENTATION=-
MIIDDPASASRRSGGRRFADGLRSMVNFVAAVGASEFALPLAHHSTQRLMLARCGQSGGHLMPPPAFHNFGLHSRGCGYVTQCPEKLPKITIRVCPP